MIGKINNFYIKNRYLKKYLKSWDNVNKFIIYFYIKTWQKEKIKHKST
jgi:hypothetical protein